MGLLPNSKFWTIKGETATLRIDLESLNRSNPDISYAYSADVTFVIADENCTVYFSKKKTFLRRNGKIIIDYDIPYSPMHYLYLVYNTKIS